MRKILWAIAIAIPTFCLLTLLIFYLPPVHSRLAWRVDEFVLRIRYSLNPPQEVVFVPKATSLPAPRVWTLTPSILFTGATTPEPAEDEPTATPLSLPSSTSTPPSTPLPEKVLLSGVRYEDQHGRFNYCAPANLAMALSFWKWQGDRDVVGPILKPDPKDKNVMPYEMVDYVNNNTEMRALERAAGDLDTLKRFIAAGFPVLVEKAAYFRDLSGINSWMGHYQVVTGYDDAKAEFIAQDSFVSPDISVPYAVMEKNWRAFNDTYILIYPPDRETEVQALLGQDADETNNFQRAASKASEEIFALSGIDQYYAWFNRGTNLMRLQDYAGAAEAYDRAFSIYPTIPEAERPWRMLWYQTGPYFAYYHSGRTWDVLNLAETTLSTLQSEKNLEESFYWRGMAKAALGDTSGAIEDFREALKYHRGFQPALYQLQLLGIEP
jgi:tetratricopeptide (TPR) repeat protein